MLLEFHGSMSLMNWLQIADIGNSKIVKSMMIWMFVTPIFAKSLSSVNSVELSFFKTDQSLSLTLPFSWQIFFFCAVFFTVANIFYTLKCPSIVSKYKSFSDFKTKEDSRYLLVSHLVEHVSQKMIDKHCFELGSIVTKYTSDSSIRMEFTSDDTSNVNWERGIDSLKHTQQVHMPDVFSSSRILLAKINPVGVYFCVFFYALGFIGMSVVILQNIQYVYEQMKF
jgi:hypothetical protein